MTLMACLILRCQRLYCRIAHTMLCIILVSVNQEVDQSDSILIFICRISSEFIHAVLMATQRDS
jgi:hypothetical protein